MRVSYEIQLFKLFDKQVRNWVPSQNNQHVANFLFSFFDILSLLCLASICECPAGHVYYTWLGDQAFKSTKPNSWSWTKKTHPNAWTVQDTDNQQCLSVREENSYIISSARLFSKILASCWKAWWLTSLLLLQLQPKELHVLCFSTYLWPHAVVHLALPSFVARSSGSIQWMYIRIPVPHFRWFHCGWLYDVIERSSEREGK